MAFVYSCCFWFSLRLGGILIGLFSIIQATVALVFLSIIHRQPENAKEEISLWMKDINLIYINDLLETFLIDPEKYITYFIVVCCIYIIISLSFIYGAYTCNNIMMVVFILVELIRLILLSIIVTTCLLVFKQNTMDIGLVIGASVASGFVLLGMFYLWVCAANLPILINEMEREEHEATIIKLQQMIENKNDFQRDHLKLDGDSDFYRRNPFVVPMSNIKYGGTMKTVQFNNPYHFIQ